MFLVFVVQFFNGLGSDQRLFVAKEKAQQKRSADGSACHAAGATGKCDELKTTRIASGAPSCSATDPDR